MADPINFTIQKLNVIDGPPSERGTRLLATFNLGFPGVIVHGCVLVERTGGSR
ncbi:hypothetical protein RGQ15_10185 [Paracoccus sp. MBLB3053]|uniref:Uncharacterized protein n=1 Tax=Paracoccus aurantius TaxID=3073814 RepID=A0ABU2HSD1_9RHOB|nr:hypothetical protein [Paracoccus sp. MBLB3053]MDS9467933.1 hypothetical protein [Paracoccus sp. MBLB3053]